jgi:hypothetical protein
VFSELMCSSPSANHKVTKYVERDNIQVSVKGAMILFNNKRTPGHIAAFKTIVHTLQSDFDSNGFPCKDRFFGSKISLTKTVFSGITNEC